MFIYKRFLKYLIILVILIIPTVVTFNDCKLYKEPIGSITAAHTEKMPLKHGASDQTYKQTLTIKLMNTSDVGNSYKYKTAANPTMPRYDAVCTSGYTAWNGTDEITATTGQKIVIVEVDSANKAKKAGIATIASMA